MRPLQSSPGLEGVLRLLRSVSPAMMADRSLARDMEAVHHLVCSGDIGHAIERAITMTRTSILYPEDFPPEIRDPQTATLAADAPSHSLDTIEREQALEHVWLPSKEKL